MLCMFYSREKCFLTNKHRLRQLSYVMVHDSNFVLTESIITALKEKFVTVFSGIPLLFEVLF